MKKTKTGLKRNVVGERVRQARIKADPPVSQDDLCGRLAKYGIQLDRSAISRIENQGRYAMDYEVLAIARCLKVPVASLFGEGE